MNKPSGKVSRKKILRWGAAALAAAAAFRFIKPAKKNNTATVKMLTQDGKLVEIDKKLLAGTGKKITNKELQQFIKCGNHQQ